MAITDQQIFDFFLGNPTDDQTFEAMKTFGISPQRIATATGTKVEDIIPRLAPFLPRDKAVLLGDTWIQGNYQYMQSGEDNQLGPIESIQFYKTTGGIYDKIAEGTDIQNYSPSGEFLGTSKMGKDLSFFGGIKQALKDPYVLGALALATAGATGLLSGGAATTAGTAAGTGLGASTSLGTGLTAGAGGLGLSTTGAGLGTLGTGAGITAGTGLGTGVLTGSALGTGLLGAGALTGAGVLGGSTLGTTLAGTGTGVTAGTGTAAGTGLGTVAGMGTGTGLTAGAGGLGLSTTGAGLGAAGTGAGITAGTGLGTGVLAGSGLGTTLLGTGAGTALTGTGILAGSGLGTTLLGTGTGTAVTGGVTGLGAGTLGTGALTTGVGTALTGAGTGLGGLTAAQLASLLSTGLTTGGGLLQQQTSREAAQAALQIINAETAAAKQGAQFRPIGMTTRFGTSQFVIDPVTGRLTSAGYTLDPQAKNAQDRLVKLAESGLQQAEGAQAQFAPLQTAAQSLYGLGQGYLNAQTDPRLAQIASQYLSQSPQSQRLTALGGDYLTQSPESKMLTSLGSRYIAQSPEQVAQNYLNQQMALLQPGRETELANLQNRLQQQGRGGLSVAQGGTLGATTPELQALYNARAQQELQLAAGAQQAGQQQVQFGAGLVGTGQQLGMAGQQFGANLIGTGQQLGIQGQQFGMDTLARQQALEQQRLAFGSGLFSQGAGLMGQYYGGQQAAYAPYTTALGQVQGLEQLAQQPLQMGINLGQIGAQTGFDVGRLGLQGAGQATTLATGPAATNNPYASLLSGVAANPLFGAAGVNALGRLFG